MNANFDTFTNQRHGNMVKGFFHEWRQLALLRTVYSFIYFNYTMDDRISNSKSSKSNQISNYIL